MSEVDIPCESSAAGEETGMKERIRDLETLASRLGELVEKHQLSGLEAETSIQGEKVKLRLWGREAPMSRPAAQPPAIETDTPASSPPPITSRDLDSHPGAVPSPMVGTVYLQPEPGSNPFVDVGQRVEEGAELLIIEAMKTMNRITAPHAGVVKRILVEDGAPVEFGAPLMIIE